MLHGSPQYTASQESAKINLDKELKAQDGAAKISELPPVHKVKIDASAVLRIVKHARDNTPHRVFGDLLGVQLADTIEVCNVQPHFPYSGSIHETEPERKEREQRDDGDAKAAIELLRTTGMGGLPVGSYVGASQSQYFSRQSIQNLRGLDRTEPSLLIVYDPLRSQFGKMYLRAFVPTEQLYAFVKSGEIAAKLPSLEGVLREVPIEFEASVLGKMLLQDVASKPRHVQNALVAQGGLDQYNEKSLKALVDGMDRLRMDIQHNNYSNEKDQANNLNMDAQIMVRQLQEESKHLSEVAKGTALDLHFLSLGQV